LSKVSEVMVFQRRRRTVWLAIVPSALIAQLSCAPDAPQGGVPTHPGDSYSITIGWNAPTLDAMGRPLSDLQGFRVYYSTSQPPDGPEAVSVDVGLVEEYTVDGLSAGLYYVAVSALDTSGNESELSEALAVEVGS
jgi:hypothetical protein